MKIDHRLAAFGFAMALLLALAACGDDDGGFDTSYPSAGEDRFERTVATVEIEVTLPGVGALPVALTDLETVQLEGPMLVLRGDPQDSDGDDLVDIETEIVELQLTGTSSFGPLEVRQSPERRSMGIVEQQTPGQDFPADSFFDVFLEVEILDIGLIGYNPEAIRMEAELSDLPPGFRDQYEGALVLPTPLLSADSDVEFAMILDALHVPNPPPTTPGATPAATATVAATPTAAPTPTTEPAPTDEPHEGVGGTYPDCTVTVLVDQALHAGPIGMPPMIDLEVSQSDSMLRIDGPPPWVPVDGPLLDDGGFPGTGMGGVAGFPDVQVQFDAFFEDHGFNGTYGMGVGGGLPEQQPITYQVDCQSAP